MNTRRSQAGQVVVGAVFAATLAYALMSESRYGQSMVMWIALHALTAVSLRFVLLIGEKNIATAAFFGIGGYASAVATVHFGWPFAIAIAAGAAAAALASFLFGLVTLRVKGPYFMLISFSFTALLCLLYSKWDFVGGNAGMSNILPPTAMEPFMPAFVLATCAALVLGLYLCERSPLGKLFLAIRDNDAIVASVGVDVVRAKVICLVLASAAAGVAGSLTAFTNTIITPLDFQFSVVVFLLAYVMVGGQGHVMGAVVGAALLTLLSQSLQGHSEWEQIVFGAAIVGSMLFLRDGLMGLWDRACDRLAAWTAGAPLRRSARTARTSKAGG